METNRSAKKASSTALRRWARVLGLLLSGIFVVFFVGQSLESRSRGAPPDSGIGPAGIAGLALFGIYVLAMLLALRWERICVRFGAGALGSFYVMMFLGLFQGNVQGGLSRKGVLSPVLLIFWVPIVLYVVCWRVERSARTVSTPPG